ncbi:MULTISPECIES: glutamate synthase subunit beta [unclassified Oceanispirochaeta]|uniref:glutamate synthase subunit beta n=1 Tax=unclassified Oceanispirochaeta TaxID=2635722 RepID=UPI000E09639F|nr:MULTISPECIES: glutamate synthase subunit beta [unclassified Oceanispirochaeta]MBF9016254.1 glutamate synthase subunit beta [Oceanispirochaeta sp. M2]NPD72716.1 glutamate synthase subunit beta [Oceanispirochaeta sp. M1]RDG31863.1 glutamate synthase subunit beta [Oceanispirochaeta sp. M1]
MGKVLGFLEHDRTDFKYRAVEDRLKDYKEVMIPTPIEGLADQGARCMDCGTPFCHNLGCPISNLIPEWNDAVYRGQYKEAFERLEITNNFPEVTGRICPAPCETSCTLSINDAPVAIKQMELGIIEKAFAAGWVVPRPPRIETGKSVAVVGSGPSGMAASQQLRRMGHQVTLFEKSEKIGGLLRYGIPDFKLDKSVLDRRIQQMKAEGVSFETGVAIGEDLSIRYLQNKYDSVLITMGAGAPRNLPVPGRELKGVHFAMEYLGQSNKNVSGEFYDEEVINAKGKTVLVIGGGDTGSDCVGTANRQGAEKVYQYEIMPKPLDWKNAHNPSWPDWPSILRTSSSHNEGCERDWNISTLGFYGKKGFVEKGSFQRVEWKADPAGGRPQLVPIVGSEFDLDVDLVFLAMGFVHVEHNRIITDLNLELDGRGNIKTDGNYGTTIDGVFAAGDAETGASLVVRALGHGRSAAEAVDAYLK